MHGVQTYEKVLKAMVQARKLKPINLVPDQQGDVNKEQREQDVIFVVSTEKNLMPTIRIKTGHPSAFFVRPDEQFLDLFQNYLPHLDKIEGLSRRDFIEKCLNADEVFAAKPGDDD